MNRPFASTQWTFVTLTYAALAYFFGIMKLGLDDYNERLALVTVKSAVSFELLYLVIAPLFPIIAALLIWHTFRHARRKAEAEQWLYCTECEYPLKGIEKEIGCPECGTRFHQHELPELWAQRWQHPLRWTWMPTRLRLATIACCLGLLTAFVAFIAPAP